MSCEDAIMAERMLQIRLDRADCLKDVSDGVGATTSRKSIGGFSSSEAKNKPRAVAMGCFLLSDHCPLPRINIPTGSVSLRGRMKEAVGDFRRNEHMPRSAPYLSARPACEAPA